MLLTVLVSGCGEPDSTSKGRQAQIQRADNFADIMEAGELPELATPTLEIQDQSPVVGLEGVTEQAATLRPALEALRAALDRTQFDLTELNASLDLDPAKLTAFVRDQVAFEQYPGILRGARGTLIARAGNALDQSLLLAYLLDEAGMDWRIVHARLTPGQAATLVGQMTQPRPEAPGIGDVDEIQAALRTTLLVHGIGENELDQIQLMLKALKRNPFVDQTDADTRFVLGALREAGIDFRDGEADGLDGEAQDYFFVEHRADAYDPWEAAHPAFRAAVVPSPLERIATFTEPDEELHHRVRVNAFIEQKIGNQLVTHEVLATPTYTSAELVDRPRRISILPNNLDPTQPRPIAEVVADAGVFMPALEGQASGKAFDLDGRIYDIAVAGMDRYGFTELLQAGASQAEQGLGAIADLGGPERSKEERDNFMTLTAHWIEYTMVGPGGQETTERRYLLDRIGPVNREAGLTEIIATAPIAEAAVALVTSTTLISLVGGDNFAHVMDRLAERALTELSVISAIDAQPEPGTLPTGALAQLAPIQDIQLSMAVEAGHGLHPGVVSYRNAPMIAAYQQGFVPDRTEPTGFERVDVVANPRRVFTVEDGVLLGSFADTVRAGVWETHAEGAPIVRPGTKFNTMISLRDAQAQDIPIRVYTDEEAIRASELDDQTKFDLIAAVSAGSAVVVPERKPLGAESLGWWQVDLATGETLGVATGGYGITTSEYIILTVSIPLNLLSLWSCLDGGGEVACCVVTTAAVAFTGYVLGGLAVTLAAGGRAGLTAAEFAAWEAGEAVGRVIPYSIPFSATVVPLGLDSIPFALPSCAPSS